MEHVQSKPKGRQGRWSKGCRLRAGSRPAMQADPTLSASSPLVLVRSLRLRPLPAVVSVPAQAAQSFQFLQLKIARDETNSWVLATPSALGTNSPATEAQTDQAPPDTNELRRAADVMGLLPGLVQLDGKSTVDAGNSGSGNRISRLGASKRP